ncbi:hypothetical protein SAMN05216480_101674 [Pustulibacterium marinum]|uniref:Outer membrane protein assembly factor BamA n=1 Tax=Pustulibacterium marinum TaxID=1224947 RepID=A0A1I7F652_9FLAO|nr:hypothetical protein [Pustulibacterium marinum]SFU31691.1 hypothetical protein SAMN05216480_101674 [Pustulibacterium marinum]
MNQFRFFLLFITCTAFNNYIYGQDIELSIHINDSVNLKSGIAYKKNHQDFSSAQTELTQFISQLETLGYFNHSTPKTEIQQKKIISKISIGHKIDSVYISENHSVKKINIEEFNQYILFKSDSLKAIGKPFEQVKLINQEIIGNKLLTQIIFHKSETRILDSIEIKGYPNFPQKFLKHYAKIQKGQLFNISNIKTKAKKLSNLNFISQSKQPETLFTRDSTTLFLYLKKTNNNYLDGYIGFGNNEETNNFKLNGTVDINLMNNLNKGESLKIYWKNNGDNQSTFQSKATIPYLANTPITTEAGINILKQDSTYNNTSIFTNTYYQLAPKHNLGITYSNLTSTTLNTSDNSIEFSKNLFGINYQFNYNQTNLLNPESCFTIAISTGKRKSYSQETNQNLLSFQGTYIFKIKPTDKIFLHNTTEILFSKNYLFNELFFIGGINSIRGFNENSISTNNYSIFNLEYQKILTKKLYLNSITDFGYHNTYNTNEINKLYSLGFGIGLVGDNNLFKLNYAVGFTSQTAQNLINSKIHISYTTFF